mmetsp:Transcript_23029/g.50234  ORF Transcript_23029/g.50234 Transcript_23029/m.50234 type:complete len:95 (-) Transcript_23029:1797-2081(-)
MRNNLSIIPGIIFSSLPCELQFGPKFLIQSSSRYLSHHTIYTAPFYECLKILLLGYFATQTLVELTEFLVEDPEEIDTTRQIGNPHYFSTGMHR